MQSESLASSQSSTSPQQQLRCDKRDVIIGGKLQEASQFTGSPLVYKTSMKQYVPLKRSVTSRASFRRSNMSQQQPATPDVGVGRKRRTGRHRLSGIVSPYAMQSHTPLVLRAFLDT